MGYNIRPLEKTDLDEVIRIAKSSFYKFKLHEKGHIFDEEYCRQSLLLCFQNQYTCGVFDGERCCGFFLATKMPTMYNRNISQFVDFGLQPDSQLSKLQQSKVLVTLINRYEEVCKLSGCQLCGISISPLFDISRFLLKRGYEMCDVTYFKRILCQQE